MSAQQWEYILVTGYKIWVASDNCLGHSYNTMIYYPNYL